MSQFKDQATFEKASRKVFNESLRGAIDLGSFVLKVGLLDRLTWDALETVANEYPNAKPKSVKAARDSFREYLEYLHEVYGQTKKSG